MKNLFLAVHRFLANRGKEGAWKKAMRPFQEGFGKPPIDRIDGRIMIVVPHADDELIACHSFIEQNKGKCVLFYCGLTGSNNLEENANKRRDEFVKYCNSVKVRYVESTKDIASSFVDCLQDTKPDFVFVPSFLDWHPEHRKIHSIVMDSLTAVGQRNINIALYRVSVPMPPDLVNFVVKMSRKQQNEKWTLFNGVYESQRHLNIQRFQFIEKNNIKYNHSSEVFSIMSIDGCKELDDSLINHLKEINNLKDYLQDGGKLFRETLTIYNKSKGEVKK